MRVPTHFLTRLYFTLIFDLEPNRFYGVKTRGYRGTDCKSIENEWGLFAPTGGTGVPSHVL